MKTVVSAPKAPRKPRLTWEMVLAVLDEPETRSVAFSVLRPLQIKPSETWAHAATKQAVADGLTRAEDFLETNHPTRRAERERVKRVRRRLECEVYP